MRAGYLCASVLTVASGPWVGLAGCGSALGPRWFILLTVLGRWSRCRSFLLPLFYFFFIFFFFLLFIALWFILRGGLFYVLPCISSCLCFSYLLALRLGWGARGGLVLVLFVRLFGSCLFLFVCFLFLLVSGWGWGCCVFVAPPMDFFSCLFGLIFKVTTL